MTVINGQKVTAGNSPLSTGESEGAPAERETGPEDSTLHSERFTVRDRLVGWFERSRDYWLPPNLLTNPPASFVELSAYAHRAGWTRRLDGPVRAAGIAYHRLVGLPVTVVCRYIEWICQRPGRLVPVYGVWKLFVSTGPGPAIADNVIRPCLAVAGWVLL